MKYGGQQQIPCGSDNQKCKNWSLAMMALLCGD